MSELLAASANNLDESGESKPESKVWGPKNQNKLKNVF